MTETVVNLKPESAWRPGMTRETLIAELDAATTLPGVSNIWTQPIINRINMLTTGIRSEVGVKVFGNDLRVLEERARAVADVLRRIPGAVDVVPEQVTGAPYLDVRVNREAAARYGITVGAVQDVIDPRVDAQARTAKVRVEVPNPGGRLRLGMYVSMVFTTRGAERVVVVPRSAVQSIGERSVVYLPVKDEEGKFVQRQIRLGQLMGDSYTVLAGLRPGDVVVTEGSFFLRAESLRNAPSG